MTTLGRLLDDSAAHHGDKTALICNGQKFSYNDLARLSDTLAQGLRRVGIQRGDRVSLYSQNSWEWIVSYYAVLKIGAVVNPINGLLTPSELLDIVADCGASAIITSRENAASVLKIREQVEALKHVLVYGRESEGSTMALDTLLSEVGGSLQQEVVSPEDVGVIGYTSSVSGEPRGVMLSHRGAVTNAMLTANMHMKGASDVVVSCLSASRLFGAAVMNQTFLTGGTLVLFESFDADEILEAMKTWKATVFEGMPSMYEGLLGRSRTGATACSLRMCTIGGPSMPTNRMREVEELFGCRLITVWGLAETSGIAATHPYFGEPRYGSIGLPLPGCPSRIAALHDPGKVLLPGEIGELQMRGPILMKGYVGAQASSRSVIEPNGWLHTGVVGKSDEFGNLYIVDRLVDCISTGGYVVSAVEIERVLEHHPAVAVAGVGVATDEIRGDFPKAYVVLRPGAETNEQEILSFCRERLAGFKLPKQVRFVRSLPIAQDGRIMRRDLRALDSRDDWQAHEEFIPVMT